MLELLPAAAAVVLFVISPRAARLPSPWRSTSSVAFRFFPAAAAISGWEDLSANKKLSCNFQLIKKTGIQFLWDIILDNE